LVCDWGALIPRKYINKFTGTEELFFLAILGQKPDAKGKLTNMIVV